MNSNLLFDFTVDKTNRTIHLKREFTAPLDRVWAAWTQADLLDQWWAPKPYTTETKSMDFRPGGRWHYAMVSPEGNKHWGLVDYETVDDKESFSHLNAFCDENQNFDPDAPRSTWMNRFSGDGDRTLVDIVIAHQRLEDLERYIAMGFKEGFASGLRNLDELLASKT